MTDIEFEFPILTNSSANVREMVAGNTSTLESATGSAVINTVWAEAGRAIKEIAKSPVANMNLDIFTMSVYPR